MLCLSIVPRCALDRVVDMTSQGNGLGQITKRRIRLEADRRLSLSSPRPTMGASLFKASPFETIEYESVGRAAPIREAKSAVEAKRPRRLRRSTKDDYARN